MFEFNKEIYKEIDNVIGNEIPECELDTSAGWRDKCPQLTKEELLSRNSFGSDKERLANNKWLDKLIAEGGK